ncbi:MAG: hypothetical protein WBE92_17920 [Steroidobacteraceae bacterium]
MNTKRFLAPWFAVVFAIGLATGPALANKPAFNAVSGSVTSAPIAGQITVDGHTYRIQSGSNADTQAADVHVGESVLLQLSGPPDSDSTEVVAIHATPSR